MYIAPCPIRGLRSMYMSLIIALMFPAYADAVHGLQNKNLPHELRAEYVTTLIREAVITQSVDWGQEDISAMRQICWYESRYRPYAQNPETTAYGLYQFLDSTWDSTDIKKTDNAFFQTVAAVRYVEARYGNPRRALTYIHNNGYY